MFNKYLKEGVSMDRNDYVKYLTEEMVKYMQLSKQEKKQR
ncbi:YqzE family protein, partial [Halobacillus sp. BBL2006]